jgi:site-specific DNA-cytosine methylase
MRKTITLLDLFSGIGGFHLGLERAGFKVKSYSSEIDKYANQVYKHNFKNSTYVGSVTDVRGSELPRINAITFGSPCQDFSIAGNRKGMGGERSSLILEAIRLIKECRPDFFIWENVKGTFSSNNRQDFAAILQAFANIGGYRQREDGESPCLTSSKNSENALSSMPPIINKIRRLTPIECERLQGFPDNWTQQGVNGPISDTQRYKMCGNAVTVDVVEAVAKQILKL